MRPSHLRERGGVKLGPRAVYHCNAFLQYSVSVFTGDALLSHRGQDEAREALGEGDLPDVAKPTQLPARTLLGVTVAKVLERGKW